MYICLFYLFIVVGIVHGNKEHHLYYYFLAYPAPQRVIYHCLTQSWNSHFPWSMEVQWKEKKNYLNKNKNMIKNMRHHKSWYPIAAIIPCFGRNFVVCRLSTLYKITSGPAYISRFFLVIHLFCNSSVKLFSS